MSIRRILVADDEESIRWVLSKALKKKGFNVDLAEDGKQAQLRAMCAWPDSGTRSCSSTNRRCRRELRGERSDGGADPA